MPLGILNRLPIPTLTTYSVISAALFVSLIYNAKHAVENPDWKSEFLTSDKNSSDIIGDEEEEHLIDLETINLPESIRDILFYMIQDNFSRWVCIDIKIQ